MGAKIRSRHEMKVVIIGADIAVRMTALEIQRQAGKSSSYPVVR
ncbi:hypothetical protein [Bradyrhizobium sp. ISRA430]|nr:hypothetical protein [Bradyrhizobium sp. ISRA430]